MLAAALVSWMTSPVATACGRAPNAADSSVRAIDLLHESARASKRPDPSAFSLGEYSVSGDTRPALAGSAPCRIIWTVRLPPRSILRTMVAAVPPRGEAATITFRVGISDDRVYDALAEQRLSIAAGEPSRWVPLTVDLSLYGGWQWSLFHRPDSHPWRLVFNADRTEGRGEALWGSPGVDTDVRGAREWRQKAAR